LPNEATGFAALAVTVGSSGGEMVTFNGIREWPRNRRISERVATDSGPDSPAASGVNWLPKCVSAKELRKEEVLRPVGLDLFVHHAYI
jgi:hypothetical protein